MTILLIILVIVIFVIFEYNKCISLRNKTKQSKSGIEVYLNQRFDLIPNLVECVKGYAAHEKELLEKAIELRGKYLNQTDKNLQDGAKLNSECNRLLVIAENIPELKASSQFLELEKALIKMESQLQAARRIYNGDVTLYNTKIASFPTNILAAFFELKEIELFEIEEFKKVNIDVNI